MENKRRTVSFLLTFIMVISLFAPVNVMAANELSTTINEADIQKFGNVPLMLKGDELMFEGYSYGDILNVSFLDHELKLPLCNTYSDVEIGCPAIIARNSDTPVLLAINMGDFATSYGIAAWVMWNISCTRFMGA